MNTDYKKTEIVAVYPHETISERYLFEFKNGDFRESKLSDKISIFKKKLKEALFSTESCNDFPHFYKRYILSKHTYLIYKLRDLSDDIIFKDLEYKPAKGYYY